MVSEVSHVLARVLYESAASSKFDVLKGTHR